MSLLRKRAWWQKLIHSRLTLAAVILLSIFLAFSVYDRYTIDREVAERRTEKETELASLNNRKATLEEKVQYLEGEQGQEAEIRSHFDVAKEGEQVVVLTGNEESSIKPISNQNEATSSSWWHKILFWWPF